MGGCKALVTTFIVELFVSHDQEYYLSIVSDRLGRYYEILRFWFFTWWIWFLVEKPSGSLKKFGGSLLANGMGFVKYFWVFISFWFVLIDCENFWVFWKIFCRRIMGVMIFVCCTATSSQRNTTQRRLQQQSQAIGFGNFLVLWE